MLETKIDPKRLPLLLTVDGESKTAKTTGTNAIRNALEDEGLTVYEADAGAFFRRMTVCVLEKLQCDDLDGDHIFSNKELYDELKDVIAADSAFADRLWPNLQSKLVERYVSVIGNTPIAQHAMDTWYDKLIDISQARKFDVLAINARNPRDRLAYWKAPVLDLLVYCSPSESAKRILYARGVKDPSAEQLAAQTAEVEKRRTLDRNRDKYPYIDPCNVIDCIISDDESIDSAAAQAVQRSWHVDPDGDANLCVPATIRLDTTHISLVQTRDTIAALAREAIAYAVAR